MRRDPCTWLGRRLLGAIGILMLLEVFAGTSLRAEKMQIAPTLLLHPVKVDVVRGKAVDVRLEAVAASGNQIEFRISAPPRYGSIGSPRLVSQNVAVVTYENNGHPSASDGFEFRIKSPGRAWSTHQAILTIKDPTNCLKVTPETLDFGSIAVGEISEKSLEIQNSMAESVAGVVMPPSPWKVMTGETFSLKYGEKIQIRIVFHPREAGKYQASVGMIPGVNGSKVILKGDAITPFALRVPDHSGPTSSTPLEIKVKNSMDHPIVVVVKTDPPLASLKPIRLAAAAEGKVLLRRNEVSVKETRTTVVFSSGDYEEKLSLILPEAPAAVPSDSKNADSRSSKQSLSQLPDQERQGIQRPKEVLKLPADQRVNKTVAEADAYQGSSHQEIPLEPTVLPEETQKEIRRLIVRDISSIVKEGLWGWNLLLRWKCDDPRISEFLVEESPPIPDSEVRLQEGFGRAFRPIKPRILKVLNGSVWEAKTSVSSPGVHAFRITPVSRGRSRSVSAAFEVFIPPQRPFLERYRMVFAVLLAAALIGFVYFRKRNQS